MRPSLQARAQAQVQNEAVLRKVAKLGFEEVIKLGAMMCTNVGKEADVGRIKDCKRILKSKAGLFSDFRSTLEFVVRTKMALAGDPEAYIDAVMGVYEKLKGKRIFTSSMLAMASTTIYENCPPERLDEVVNDTLEAYARLKEQHSFLTDDADLSMIALMIMAGKDVDGAVDEAESLFQTMRANYKIRSDVAQSAAMVLALCDKPAEQKIAEFFDLYQACKDAGHATSRDKSMVIYAAFAGKSYDRAEVVATIGELDEWLKGQKGYGMFGVGGSMRRLFAASMTLEDIQVGSAASEAGVTGAVTQVVVEELVVILMMIILTSIIISTAAASSH